MEGEPQQRPPRVSLGHRPTLCAGFLFPLAPNKKDAQRFLRRLIPYGGKESVKENRQDCLSRFIRAQTNPLRRLSAPLAPNKKDARGLPAQTVPSGGKDSVKENRQGCLSRLIRAGSV